MIWIEKVSIYSFTHNAIEFKNIVKIQFPPLLIEDNHKGNRYTGVAERGQKEAQKRETEAAKY